MTRHVPSLAMLALGLAIFTTATSAMPLSGALAMRNAGLSNVETVRWGGGGWGGRGWGGGWRGGGWGWGVGAGLLGGAIVGSALAAPYYGYGPYYPAPYYGYGPYYPGLYYGYGPYYPAPYYRRDTFPIDCGANTPCARRRVGWRVSRLFREGHTVWGAPPRLLGRQGRPCPDARSLPRATSGDPYGGWEAGRTGRTLDGRPKGLARRAKLGRGLR
jgi:hypothetical protein